VHGCVCNKPALRRLQQAQIHHLRNITYDWQVFQGENAVSTAGRSC
jgi:hypothetical protein